MARYQDLGSFRLPPGSRGRSAFVVQLWWLVQAVLVQSSPQFMYGWRAFWWRAFGATVGKGCLIRPSARVTYPWKVRLGANCWIGDRAELYSLESITVGDNACISQDCYICTGSHEPARLDFAYANAPVEIGSEVWIAAGAFVGPGVSIGDGAVIGARSLVLTPLEGGGIYAGQPARWVRQRPEAGGAGA
ncbi:WcaF family extracellular polysaccharide biosynthesis acetyltransferase [Vannielia litorea]|nr:WcaF family extracellular polysaccharide biosynthesis acetyltransferase [Vannielia litorea]MBY6076216.1 WcaF family extracellular polysaccharide biosynthesis acetyltransferase [Vannielia litorea]